MKKISLLALTLVASLSLAHSQAIWTLGHGDIGIGYENGNEGVFEPHWHLGEDGEVVVVDGVAQSNDPTGFEYETDALNLRFAASALRPAGSEFDFVGVAAGLPVWLLPDNSVDSNTAGVPFLGFGTEELNRDDWSSSILLTLTGITGSGVDNGGFFSVFVDSANIQIQSFGGITSAVVISLSAGDHVHFNMAFTQPGIYNVTFEITGTHVTDLEQVGTGTYTFEVIPEPATTLLLALSGGALLLRRRRKVA